MFIFVMVFSNVFLHVFLLSGVIIKRCNAFILIIQSHLLSLLGHKVSSKLPVHVESMQRVSSAVSAGY